MDESDVRLHVDADELLKPAKGCFYGLAIGALIAGILTMAAALIWVLL